jgi:hypothetical protein
MIEVPALALEPDVQAYPWNLPTQPDVAGTHGGSFDEEDDPCRRGGPHPWSSRA